MKRLAALILAALLVLSAVLVSRSIFDWDDADANGGGAGGDRPSDEMLDVVCATEFEAACEALDADGELDGVATFRTEPPGATSAALAASPEPGFDLWLTSTPWPELTRLRAPQDQRPRVRVLGRPVGESALEGAHRDNTDIGCPAPLVGRCVLAGGADGSTTLGLRPPTQTAGVLALAAVTSGWFDVEDFDAVDIGVNDEFTAALSRAAGSSDTVPEPVRTVLTVPQFDLALDLNVAAQLDAAAGGDRFKRVAFAEPVLARAVVVGGAGDAGTAAVERLGRDRVADAVRAQGWSAPTDRDDGVPGLGALEDLVTRWSTR